MSTEERKAKRERSPSYPAIDLPTALRRAEQLWQREKDHWAPIPAIYDAWGYSPKSSGGAQAVASLKRYGLLEDRGNLQSREGRLTEFARAILLDEREDSPERLKRLQEAALKPGINREIWAKYQGSLPSDATLRYYLTVERGFGAGGAVEFLRQFHRTLEFARMTGESATVSPDEPDSAPDSSHEAAEPPRVSPVASQVTTPLPSVSPLMPPTAPAPIQFPVYGGGTVVLQSTVPLTEKAWDQMMEVLKVLKPSIVTPPQSFAVHLEDVAADVTDEAEDDE